MWLYKRFYHVLKNEFVSTGTPKMGKNSAGRWFLIQFFRLILNYFIKN